MLAGEVDCFLGVDSRPHDFEVGFECDQSPQRLAAMSSSNSPALRLASNSPAQGLSGLRGNGQRGT
jgi:hypothetical protein